MKGLNYVHYRLTMKVNLFPLLVILAYCIVYHLPSQVILIYMKHLGTASFDPITAHS